MRTRERQITLCVCCILFGTWVCAGQDKPGYMGVLLDPEPLPPLLTKHLDLSPDQGLRVKNVNRHTPADKAGLERDDIIIGLDGQDVVDYERFVDTVRNAGAQTTVTLEIIHKGQRKTLKLELGAPTTEFAPKFPPEPAAVQAWRPGKMFHFDTNADGWIEIDVMDIDSLDPGVDRQIRTDIRRAFKEHYTFHYGDSDPACTVTIDGDPHDPDTLVTVEKGKKTYSTTVSGVDALPGQVQDYAKRAIKQARQSARKRTRTRVLRQHSQAVEEFMDEHAPEGWENYTDKILDRVKVFMDKHEKPLTLRGSEKLEQIESHLKDLTARMEKLEQTLLKKLGQPPRHEEASESKHEDDHDHGHETHESADNDDSLI